MLLLSRLLLLLLLVLTGGLWVGEGGEAVVGIVPHTAVLHLRVSRVLHSAAAIGVGEGQLLHTATVIGGRGGRGGSGGRVGGGSREDWSGLRSSGGIECITASQLVRVRRQVVRERKRERGGGGEGGLREGGGGRMRHQSAKLD